jgi:ketosteroid isomerase-like protein
MADPTSAEVVANWYEALAKVDLEAFMTLHAPDCIYNVSGHTPISGRCDFSQLCADVLPQVFSRIDVANFRFATTWKIVCQDDQRVVGMMEADGVGTNGLRYDQRYLHVFEVRDGLIREVWEFFDTELAAKVLFYDPENSPTAGKLAAFEF